MVETGDVPQKHLDAQYYADKAVTAFTDATRPFDRHILNTIPDDLAAQRLIDAKDLAHNKKSFFEREVMDKFGDKIGEALSEIRKNSKLTVEGVKQAAGFWMSASYAPNANDWLMKKDAKEVAKLEAEIADVEGDPASKIIRELAKARATQKNRIEAINNPEIVDLTEDKGKVGLAGGFNNATAEKIKNDIEGIVSKELLEKVANHVYDMNEWKLKRDIENGKNDSRSR